MRQLISVNPFDQKTIARYPLDSKKKIEEKLSSCTLANEDWQAFSISARAAQIKAFAEGLLRQKQTLAEICTIEMGKPIQQSIAEVEKSAISLKYYAKNAQAMLKAQSIPTEASKSFISYEPLGTVMAIMPWNFPFWQVCRALAPIMLSGNTLMLKHASNVTGCAVAMKEIWDESAQCDNAFEILLSPGSQMEPIIADKRIQAITFTGSSPAGAAVAAVAANHLKKQVLELGGSDPYIILKDADLQQAAQICARSRLNNTGQSCIAAKRFIVESSVEEEFTKYLIEEFLQRNMGNPLETTTDIGPLARIDLRDELHQQVLKSKRKGAKILLGGEIPALEGAFYPPTVLNQVRKGMPAFDEELFGPVAAIISAHDENEAIALANDTQFGLGAAIFSKNIKKAERIAQSELQAGFVAVNTLVSSDPRLPFGGIKNSGYGRELSHWGLLEFCNVKTVLVH